MEFEAVFDLLMRPFYDIYDKKNLRADFDAFSAAIDKKVAEGMTEDEAEVYVVKHWDFDSLDGMNNKED